VLIHRHGAVGDETKKKGVLKPPPLSSHNKKSRKERVREKEKKK